MSYNFFKKTGLGLVVLSILISSLLILGYLINVFISTFINWLIILFTTYHNLTVNIIVLSLVFFASLGIIIYLVGEIYEFFFGNYQSIMVDKIDYELSETEKEKISVIIPAYNEEETIKTAINSVQPYCKHVIVVNDGSTDYTDKIAKENKAVIVRHNINKGLGQTLRDGIRRALALNSDIIVNFDADMQYHAEDIPKLVYYILYEDYDLMMGSRLAGEIESMPKIKKFGNIMYTKLLRYLTKVGITDGQTGLRAFTAEFANSIKIRGDFTYTQEMILEAAVRRAKMGEIPIHFAPRKVGESRLMSSPLDFARSSGIFLLKVLVDLSPLKIFSIVSGAMLIFGFYMGGKELIDYLIIGQLREPIWAMIGTVIIMNAIVLFCFALMISSKDSTK